MKKPIVSEIEERDRWDKFLKELDLSESDIRRANDITREVWKSFGCEWLPIIIPGDEDGKILTLAWNKWSRYLEIELMPENTSFWFYHDEEVVLGSEGEDADIDVSPTFYEAAKRFFR